MPMMRWLVMTHRYLGIAVGLLMAVWCLSGIVMMYAGYPQLTEARRVAGLSPIDWTRCCRLDDMLIDAKAERASIEMLSGRPVLRLRLAGQGPVLLDLTTGSATKVAAADAASVAQALAGSAPGSFDLIHDDQWTVAGGFRDDRPLYRFAFADPGQTRLYVSGTSGKAVQITTRPDRVLAWAGAIPHWLYFTGLRRNVTLWNQVVIWTSLLGCFLTMTGLWIGIKRLRRGRSPYGGLMFWHHMTGLVAGLFVLTWVVSGLLSMNPWGALEGEDAEIEQEVLRGPAPTVAQLTGALRKLAFGRPDAVSVSWTPFDGVVGFVATAADGSRHRLEADGREVPAIEAARSASLLDAAQPTLISQDDAYYFSRRNEPVRFPVIRMMKGATRYYVDPVTAEIVAKVDGGSRRYRWLHDGLHRLDVFPAWRSDLFRNLIMLPLLLAATAVCAIGAWLGLRRLRRDLT